MALHDPRSDTTTPAQLADELGVPVTEVRRVLASMDPSSAEDDAPPMSPEVADNVRQHLSGGMQGGVTGNR
jgi:hypothetical protein